MGGGYLIAETLFVGCCSDLGGGIGVRHLSKNILIKAFSETNVLKEASK